jgi:hypothetical protein
MIICYILLIWRVILVNIKESEDNNDNIDNNDNMLYSFNMK